MQAHLKKDPFLLAAIQAHLKKKTPFYLPLSEGWKNDS